MKLRKNLFRIFVSVLVIALAAPAMVDAKPRGQTHRVKVSKQIPIVSSVGKMLPSKRTHSNGVQVKREGNIGGFSPLRALNRVNPLRLFSPKVKRVGSSGGPVTSR